jgi:uncharacterized protein (DUF983 family)
MAAPPSPWAAGLRMKCPQCGKGGLYAGYLRLRDRCAVCDADFKAADPGDGPAVFVILIVGAICAPLLLVLQTLHVPDWLTLGITFAAVIGLSLALLPLFKATLFALQWKHKARQVTNEDVE